MMRSLPTLLVLLLLDAASSHLRYQRSVSVSSAGQSCLILDPAIYAHAAPSLADLRLYTSDGTQEIPFVLLRNASLQTDPEPAQILNLHQLGRSLSFDLQMPSRPYTDVVLTLTGTNLLARASVTTPDAAGVSLGTFTLFNLAAQHLPADTTLHLQETAAPLLHITLAPLAGSDPIRPATVQAAIVPPSREAQTLYTTAVSTSSITQAAHRTVARFTVPAHLPIERIHLTLAPGRTPNFSRPVHIDSHIAGEPESAGEQIRGAFGYLRLTRAGVSLAVDQLTVPATVGANLQKPADVQVTVENGADAPLPIASVELETRQRQLCFDVVKPGPLTLFYGDPKADPPHFDYEEHFRLDPALHHATLGPEQPNARFTPRHDVRPMTKRHPRLLYLGLILLICIVSVTTLRSKRLRL